MGGLDLMKEMEEEGALAEMLGSAQPLQDAFRWICNDL